jgi:hypothetical protein
VNAEKVGTGKESLARAAEMIVLKGIALAANVADRKAAESDALTRAQADMLALVLLSRLVG